MHGSFSPRGFHSPSRLYTARELILSRVVFVDVVALRVSLFSAVVALLGGFAKVRQTRWSHLCFLVRFGFHLRQRC
jgi:hypothetical protein